MSNKIRQTSVVLGYALTALLSGMPALAADPRAVFSAGIDAGGDKLIEFTYTDGSKQTIDANKGMYVSAGLGLPNTEDASVETQLSLGWKFDSVTAKNGDADFSTVFVDVIEAWHFESASLGLGITHQFGPKVTASGAGLPAPISAKYDAATGFVVQAGMRLQDIVIGLRYTKIEYSGPGLLDKDGSGVGLFISSAFGGNKAAQ